MPELWQRAVCYPAGPTTSAWQGRHRRKHRLSASGKAGRVTFIGVGGTRKAWHENGGGTKSRLYGPWAGSTSTSIQLGVNQTVQPHLRTPHLSKLTGDTLRLIRYA